MTGVPYQMPFMKEKGDGHGPRSAAENSPYSMLVMTGFHGMPGGWSASAMA